MIKTLLTTFLFAISPILFAQNSPSNQSNEPFKVIHGPYLQAMTDTSVSLVWVTNKKAIGWVELAPDDGTNFYHQERKKVFASRNGIKDIATLHRVNLKNLTPGTKYRYRIYSQEVLSHEWVEVRYGQVVATRAFGAKLPTFTTNDIHKEKISFLMVNDIHERNDMLKKLLEGTDWKHTDFVLFNGDMVSSSRNEKQVFAGFMDTAVKMFAGKIPMYYARGNHETRAEYASYFPEYFPGPDGKLYYLFRQGPVAFIVLDSGEDKPDDDIEYSGIADFDNYRSEQKQWLRNAVNNPVFKDAPFKVAVMHIPPLRGWHGEVEVADKFAPILDKAGIDLMLCAHYHRFVRKDAGESGFGFPVIVNSNHAVVKVTADNQTLNMNITDADGKQVDQMKIKRNSRSQQ